MAYIDIDGKKVHVVELNPSGGDPVVMVHGLFTSLALFFFEIAPKIAKNSRVVLYDLRSHGLSDRRDEGYTLDLLTEDLFAIMDALGIDGAHLVGYSYGGDVALHAAMRGPGRVRSVALIETPDMSEPAFGTLSDGFDDEIDAALVLATYRSPGGIPATKRKAERDRMVRKFLFEENLLQDAVRQDVKTLAQMPMGSLGVPALLMYGKRSPFLETGVSLAERIPGSKLRVARGDHNLPAQRGAWVARQLDSFYTRFRSS